MECTQKGCEGQYEANTKVYMDAELIEEGGELRLSDLSFSSTNDHLDGHPVALEGELEISCDSCGHAPPWLGFTGELRERIWSQTQQLCELGRGHS
jgi:hypothetical protein